MLGRQGDDAAAVGTLGGGEAGGALDGEVVGFGGAGGEHHLPRLGPEQPGDRGAGFLHRFLGGAAHGVLDAVGVGEILLPPGAHGGEDARIDRRGGVVVEVDGSVRPHAEKMGAAGAECEGGGRHGGYRRAAGISALGGFRPGGDPRVFGHIAAAEESVRRWRRMDVQHSPSTIPAGTPMSKVLQIDIANGRKLYIGGSAEGVGFAEVSASDEVVKSSAAALSKGLATLADLFGMLDRAVAALPKRPEEVEMEFRAKLTGDCDLWVVSGEAPAEFTVKVKWGKG